MVQTAVLVCLLLYTDCNLYALSAAMVIYSFLMCVLNQLAIRRALKYKQEFVKPFLKPFLAAVLMGIAAYGVYIGVYLLLPVNVAALAVAILAAVLVYFIAVMALGGVEEKDLLMLPKGYLLVQFGKRCYLLRDPEYGKYKKDTRQIKKSDRKKS